MPSTRQALRRQVAPSFFFKQRQHSTSSPGFQFQTHHTFDRLALLLFKILIKAAFQASVVQLSAFVRLSSKLLFKGFVRRDNKIRPVLKRFKMRAHAPVQRADARRILKPLSVRRICNQKALTVSRRRFCIIQLLEMDASLYARKPRVFFRLADCKIVNIGA